MTKVEATKDRAKAKKPADSAATPDATPVPDVTPTPETPEPAPAPPPKKNRMRPLVVPPFGSWRKPIDATAGGIRSIAKPRAGAITQAIVDIGALPPDTVNQVVGTAETDDFMIGDVTGTHIQKCGMIFDAMSSASRICILLVVDEAMKSEESDHEMRSDGPPVGWIAAALGVSQPNVSHNLLKLMTNRLIEKVKDGKLSRYRLTQLGQAFVAMVRNF